MKELDEKISGQELVELLDHGPWGFLLEEEEIMALAGRMTRHAYKEGEFIFREDDAEGYLAIVTKGVVDILKGNEGDREYLLTSLQRGVPFGEMSLIDQMPRSASAFAKTETEIVILRRGDFEQILYADPVLGLRVINVIARLISQRLRHTDDALVACYG